MSPECVERGEDGYRTLTSPARLLTCKLALEKASCPVPPATVVTALVCRPGVTLATVLLKIVTLGAYGTVGTLTVSRPLT